ELEKWNAAQPVVDRPAIRLGMDPLVRVYLLGILSARSGDYWMARHYADALEAMSSPAAAPIIASNLAHGIRARTEAEQGAVGKALAELEGTRVEVAFPV